MFPQRVEVNQRMTPQGEPQVMGRGHHAGQGVGGSVAALASTLALTGTVAVTMVACSS
jgi:hypothetical protein